ncbi:hypothetical protein MCERE19_01800 [Spirosomataceae bacterium]
MINEFSKSHTTDILLEKVLTTRQMRCCPIVNSQQNLKRIDISNTWYLINSHFKLQIHFRFKFYSLRCS